MNNPKSIIAKGSPYRAYRGRRLIMLQSDCPDGASCDTLTIQYQKMTDTQTYFIDIINLVPNNSICFIQAPSLENSSLLNVLTPSPFAYYKQIILTVLNKEILNKIIEVENCEKYFQSVEIKINNKLIFEGYDGMVYGTISKDLQLPNSFIKAHKENEMYIVSKEW
ncbi:MAG: hypothetical protein V4539_12245 [Bacteroidota bacterium]